MTEHHAPTRRANKVADWAEMTCLVRAAACGSDMLVELGSAIGYNRADVELGLATMRRRAALLGAAYPFKVANGAAATTDSAWRVWSSLLLMSAESPARRVLKQHEAAVHLENITVAALKSLYGPTTSAIRFGWPSEDGRPQEFADAVRWLAQRMNTPMGNAYRPPRNKDGGVDVVAWRPFPDGRSGFPVLLVQCTIERDYVHKAADVDLRVWGGWLALDVDPATALAVPEVVAAGEDWNALATRTTVLDRIRLAALVEPHEANHERLGQLKTWNANLLDAIRGAA